MQFEPFQIVLEFIESVRGQITSVAQFECELKDTQLACSS